MVNLGNVFSFPATGLNFKEIGNLSKSDQINPHNFAVTLKSNRKSKKTIILITMMIVF
ncbi:hypothetical protein B808_115 [Fructilactobacillus florum 8D]|uniref:Uncharacterized protein n=2 Tax=Fructilactobacillus florum TaxID=640331 RepID=W9EJ13_9LACO|nr:hypothetical protein B807_427 [Fructilactobacillus florum 2F]ETO40960.1 hypothetical protein B808_115 [Fructilactobacillus florum 8D]KRM91184.1 hypothetical protein FC87_GL001112 [Fructilactobacillus florum DSM 22689 = JCM 16035]